MHAFDGQTDRQTDRQTEFLSLDRVCILQRGKNDKLLLFQSRQFPFLSVRASYRTKQIEECVDLSSPDLNSLYYQFQILKDD